MNWAFIWMYIINPVFFFGLVIMNVVMTWINIFNFKQNKETIKKNKEKAEQNEKEIEQNHDIIYKNVKLIEKNNELILNMMEKNGIPISTVIKENKDLITQTKNDLKDLKNEQLNN